MDNDRPQSERSPRDLSIRDFLSLGLDQWAYVRPITQDGGEAFAIHAADGTRVAAFATREAAFSAILHHDMEPLQLH
jgi:hypothetical protein